MLFLSSIGSLYNKQGNHAKALGIFDQACALLEELDDTRARAVTLNNLALAQMMVGAYDEALLNAQASYAIFLKRVYPRLKPTCWIQLARFTLLAVIPEMPKRLMKPA